MDRTLPMTGTDHALDRRLDRGRRRLPRWIGVVFPTVLGIGLVFAGVYAADQSSLPLAVSLASTAGVGLASGAAVRWSMAGRSRLVSALVALAASLIGLLTIGLLTGGAIGVMPRPEENGTPQWAELTEVAAAAAIAWMVLSARPRFGVDLAAEGRRGRRAAEMAPLAPPRLQTEQRLPRDIGGWWGRLRRRAATGGAEPAVRRRRVANIRLTGATEHRCPYCLDEVRRGDRRGVVVCPICRTPHHADCWAVTGACQVPHAYRA